ncbi:BspA family leucine-rich repeat surface protein [Aquimarina sp. W85]|uniref:BspA family leucine-rich repeat surface protein n=1 Tax=Aquimarina rhodophyticola TaxID=3342246 RepID=UPI00366FDCC1
MRKILPLFLAFFSDFFENINKQIVKGFLGKNGMTTILFCLVTLYSINSFSQDFITVWQTSVPNETIILPNTGGPYNFDIDWGDGTIETNITTARYSHTYTTPSIYVVTITINGAFSEFDFKKEPNSAQNIMDVLQWGDLAVTSLNFKGASILDISTIDAPDLSNVTSFNELFAGATNLTADLSNWDTSTITDMTGTFVNAINFNGDITTWDTSNVTTMFNMFSGAYAINQDINGWDTSNVTNMASMFNSAVAFNQDLNNWDTSNVKFMNFMFASADNFNGNITNWETSSVTQMRSMFSSADVFNQDISGWNTTNLTDADNMFASAFSFDQDLSTWQIPNLEFMYEIFNSSGMSTDNYDKILVSWSSQPVQDNVLFGVGGMTYCLEGAARARLINDHNWDFLGDTQDCSSTVQLSITRLSDGNEGVDDIEFEVSIDGGVINTTGVDIVGAISYAGTATLGSDYTNVTSFTIPQNQSSIVVTVPVLDDDELEVTETVIATIFAPTMGTVRAANSSATAEIFDDEIPVPDPNLALIKSGQYVDANNDGVLNLGDQIAYSFSIENNGNEPITNITVFDDLPNITISGDPFDLEPGEIDEISYKGLYNLTEEDLSEGMVVNQAYVTGQSLVGVEVIDFSDDPNDDTNIDDDDDGDAEDPTITQLMGDEEFVIYQVITPNNDGLNDTFRILGLNKFPDNNLIIYNRWGASVFQTDGYEQASKPLFTGYLENEEKCLPAGTYYFALEYTNTTGKVKQKSGFLYLN